MNSFDGGNANYYCMNGIEAQDVIEAFELNFARGSAVKYILRAGRKDSEIRDLEKARAYIDREIQRLRTASDLNGLAQREAQA